MGAVAWCDNCNQVFDQNNAAFDVQFNITRVGADYGTTVTRVLCEPCSDAFTILDVDTFTQRHDTRARTLDLS